MRSEVHDLNRRAAWRWGTLVVGLLGLQVAGGIMAFMLATGDASVAIVPDYHQKALHWDDEVALQSASKTLGWVWDVSQIDEGAAVAGLRVTITDGDSKPIELASGELQIYRHARAADARRVKIPAGVPGMFELGSCLDADGLWQVTVDVSDRDGHRFTETRELYVTIPSNGAQVGEGAQ